MQNEYSKILTEALATKGGHLFIGRGGFSLRAKNLRLDGYSCEEIKAQAIAAGLPVIDSRCVEYAKVERLVFTEPMPAVGREPDPKPWTMLSFAPLRVVAKAYADAGAEIYNIA